MAVSADDLAAIDRALANAAGVAETLTKLREAFPYLRWLSCDADDVTEEPFRSYAQADLHFLDCSNHCVHVVADAAQASGVLLAQRRGA
ncbi:hypothetical protein [Acidocella sp.]|uniref:hypothetical protein n=1 Tax=Acidocella sp. TaxID=50710 RepID=UPI0017AA2EB8|nr:hypothetical protein [Acidocella sp.]NNM57806.1 hypothetical protein [Acidocella sp.]